MNRIRNGRKICRICYRLDLDPTESAADMYNLSLSNFAAVDGGDVDDDIAVVVEKCKVWIGKMAIFVKSMDPKHLLGIGLEGFYGPSTPNRFMDAATGMAAGAVLFGVSFPILSQVPKLVIAYLIKLCVSLKEELVKHTNELQQEARCIPNMTHPDVPGNGEVCLALKNWLVTHISLNSLSSIIFGWEKIWISLSLTPLPSLDVAKPDSSLDAIQNKEFNCYFLVGHNEVDKNDSATFPQAVQHTMGRPWFEAYKH